MAGTMPKWDVRCQTCGKVQTYFWTNVAERDRDLRHQLLICPDDSCLGRLEVVPSAPNFKVGGKFTEKNGYGSR